MGSSNGLNCGASLDFQARFCLECGQKTNTDRLTPGLKFYNRADCTYLAQNN